MRSKLAVIVATALLLVGCSSISAGTITAKNYSPPSSYWTQHCSYYNAKGVCTVYVPIEHHVAERYSFDLKNDNGDTGWVNVSESEWGKYEVGDYYGKAR